MTFKNLHQRSLFQVIQNTFLFVLSTEWPLKNIGPEQVPDLQHRLLIVQPDGGPGCRQAVSGIWHEHRRCMLHGACFFFILYFPTGEGLPSDSVCVYRYLFLSSYRFRVEAVEAALPNTSLVINKYYFEAALPKKL